MSGAGAIVHLNFSLSEKFLLVPKLSFKNKRAKIPHF